MANAQGVQSGEDVTVDVAVVGGGLSGLAAARALVQAGRSVVLLEASDRTGGRVRNGEVGGAVCEFGAEFVNPDQKRLHALMKELGIEYFPTYLKGTSTFIIDGKVNRFDDVPPLSLTAAAELGAAVVALDLMAAEVPIADPRKASKADEWDSQTLATWIHDNIVTAEARAAFHPVAGVFCADPREVSLLHFLWLARVTGGVEKLMSVKGGVLDSRVIGGSGVIAEKLTEALGECVRLNAPVRMIDQSAAKVRVVSDRGIVSANRVIVAVPPAIAARIDYHPRMPATRDQLTQRAPMGRAIKVFATYPTPFWRHDGLNGFGANITPGCIVTGLFDNSPPSGTPGVLFGLVEGDAAREWGPRPAVERKAAVLSEFADVFGTQALTPADYVEFDWGEAPWVRGGASAVFAPGTLTACWEALRAPVDRIHWAGTETAYENWGSMDGAVTAGERAAQEVMQAG